MDPTTGARAASEASATTMVVGTDDVAEESEEAVLDELRGDAVLAGKTRVAVVVGTRPEAVKMLPVILALRDSRLFDPFVITTGQHPHAVEELFVGFGIESDLDLSVFEPGLALAELSDRIVGHLSGVLRCTQDDSGSTPLDRVAARIRAGAPGMAIGDFGAASRPTPATDPDYASVVTHALADELIAVLVHGDTTSSMGAALAAFYNRLPVGHVEAGLRTDNLWSPYPEELNRRVISQIASLHLAPTAGAQANLVLSGVDPARISVTGNTGIDAFLLATGIPREHDADTDWRVDGARRLVVTAHRRENWEGGISSIASAVRRSSERHDDLEVVWVTHPNPEVGRMVRAELDGTSVRLVAPLGYFEFSRLLASADAVLTDSGGIQEEAPAANVPVLVARDTTERPEAVEAGCAVLVGTDEDLIVRTVDEILWDDRRRLAMAKAPNPYGDGRASPRVVAAMEHVVYGTPPPGDFGSGLARRAVLRHAGYRLA